MPKEKTDIDKILSELEAVFPVKGELARKTATYDESGRKVVEEVDSKKQTTSRNRLESERSSTLKEDDELIDLTLDEPAHPRTAPSENYVRSTDSTNTESSINRLKGLTSSSRSKKREPVEFPPPFDYIQALSEAGTLDYKPDNIQLLNLGVNALRCFRQIIEMENDIDAELLARLESIFQDREYAHLLSAYNVSGTIEEYVGFWWTAGTSLFPNSLSGLNCREGYPPSRVRQVCKPLCTPTENAIFSLIELTFSATGGTVTPTVPVDASSTEAPPAEATPSHALQQISNEVQVAQEALRDRFREVLESLAGTTRKSYDENKALLDSIRDARDRLGMAFQYREGKEAQRVSIQLSRARESHAGTFQLVTSTTPRQSLYNSAEFPPVEAFDPKKANS